MKVVFTRPALQDLDEIRQYIVDRYPALAGLVEQRIRSVLERIATYPSSSRIVEERPEVRVTRVLRFPYKIFYRVTKSKTIEILHIHHEARI
jgi:plasmid stabilization system protein ParE